MFDNVLQLQWRTQHKYNGEPPTFLSGLESFHFIILVTEFLLARFTFNKF
uniref:Uncharacterized protein n=1 Tax=Meloidogyne enterolobii TaxID=390850 RepID=A0A6V7TLU7_MELEN|nr:unnamed protein product [Meloidogyne enterolobii]